MKTAMKTKKYPCKGKTNTLAILLGLAVISLGVPAFFLVLFAKSNPKVVPWLLVFFGIADTLILIVLIRERAVLHSLFLRAFFDDTGIHCSGLFWRKHCIPWQSIRVFGVWNDLIYDYRLCLLYFWQTTESAPPKGSPDALQIMNRIDERHFVIHCNETMWQDIRAFVPTEAQSQMDEAIRNAADLHFSTSDF